MKIPLDKDDRPVKGDQYVVAATKRTKRAICWAPEVDGTVLREIFEEVDALGLHPLRDLGGALSIRRG